MGAQCTLVKIIRIFRVLFMITVIEMSNRVVIFNKKFLKVSFLSHIFFNSVHLLLLTCNGFWFSRWIIADSPAGGRGWVSYWCVSITPTTLTQPKNPQFDLSVLDVRMTNVLLDFVSVEKGVHAGLIRGSGGIRDFGR